MPSYDYTFSEDVGTPVRGRDRWIRTRTDAKASSVLSADETEGGRERKLNPQVSLRSSLKLNSGRCQRIGFKSLLQLILNCLHREKQLHHRRATSLNIQQPPS